ncbi:MAG: DNA polymerase/3'-5' exonuclease PolX [Deltaproteobacteria bacterium]
MKNSQVVKIFRNIADILEIKGENVFRIRAYNRAADVIEGLSDDIEELAKQEALTGIPGIGKDLEAKIKEIIASGTCGAYELLRKEVPEGLLQIMAVPGIGPKTAKSLYDQLQVKNVAELERAIADGKLRGMRGVKDKTIGNILKGIELLKQGNERMPLAAAIETARSFVAGLQRQKEAGKISEAGSLRRKRETVRDIDILVTSDKPGEVMDSFVSLPRVEDVVARGETKSTVRTDEGVQVDCRVVDEKSFGAALVYFTGSKNFNIRLRSIAQKKGWKVNEYGVFDVSGKQEKLLAGKTEEDIFKLFGMEFIPPEIREDTGEIELALEHKLPRLVELKDIKGDLHCHSKWSDGGETIAAMAAKARSLGYSYLAVTDHSESLKIARGLDRAALKKKRKEIDSLNRGFKDFRILFGAEVDVDLEGKPDYPDEVLADFDIVVAAVHTGFKLPKKQMTARMVRVCRNKRIHIIAHPTGRLWGARDGYDVDLTEVFKAAADTNTAMEINSFPQRLDLNDQNARQAKDLGVRIAIDTDSHAAGHLDNMILGIDVARRGWLEPRTVLNTLPVDQLLKTVRK